MLPLSNAYEGTYVHVDLVQNGLRATDESYPDASGEDLGQAVEADHSSDFGELTLEGEIRPRARGLSEVEVVVWIIWRQSKPSQVDGGK